MKLKWYISASDAHRLRHFVDLHRQNGLVKKRISQNVKGQRPPVTKARFWKALMLCLLTTQQRSGPGSPVNTLLADRRFPLSLQRCQKQRHPANYVKKVLRKHGGIRLIETIARNVHSNLEINATHWRSQTRLNIARLQHHRGYRTERDVANFLQDTYAGIGPKQSRNLLQVLGLTRYEIPIDSRVIKWLNDFGFPIQLSANGLSDISYYEFINDGIRELCHRADVFPCVLDAAMFSSFDSVPWDDSSTF